MSDASNPRSDFNPARLRFARERRGLNKEELASLCGVTRRAVTDWEAGRVEHPPVGRLGEILDFPTSFFFGEDIEEVTADAVSFRALSSMTPRQMRRVLTHASLLRAFSSWIDSRYATPTAEVPSFEELTASVQDLEPSPVDAAVSLRAMWSLGSKPISDMLALVESRGVRVFGLPAEDREIDAFSFWWGDQPYILLNTTKSAERLRFDLAHELGHLSMHRGVKTNRIRRYELDANTFASSFLMPAEGLLPQIVGPLSLTDLMKLKAHWKVSATAMTRRLHQLGRISDWQYRSWMIELSELGFRNNEPGGRPSEQSALLRQVLALAREDGWSIDRFSKELGIPERDMTGALAGLTIISVARLASAGLIVSGDKAGPPPGPPRLRAVR
jgi:Zn-dependent peptidase ImmA (M78 family)/transcriptional regulator with XRE-family HTH domain